MKTCGFCQFYKRATLPLPSVLLFFSWCIFCCCSANEREAFAEREVEGQKHLLRGARALCCMKLCCIGSSIRCINRCHSSNSHQRGTICPLPSLPIACSVRVFLPRHLASIRLHFHCLLSQSIPESGRQLTGGTCSALHVTASTLVLSGYLATRGWRFDGFLGRQLARLCICPCMRPGYMQNNLFGCRRW